MKKIGKFLFVEQCFADIEETKPCIIHIDAIDNITCVNTSRLGKVVVIETDNTKITCKNPENFKRSLLQSFASKRSPEGHL